MTQTCPQCLYSLVRITNTKLSILSIISPSLSLSVSLCLSLSLSISLCIIKLIDSWQQRYSHLLNGSDKPCGSAFNIKIRQITQISRKLMFIQLVPALYSLLKNLILSAFFLFSFDQIEARHLTCDRSINLNYHTLF